MPFFAHANSDLAAGELQGRELYNEQLDPRESEDLANTHPNLVAELSARLNAWLLEHPAADPAPPPPDSELTPEDIARLRALGYIR